MTATKKLKIYLIELKKVCLEIEKAIVEQDSKNTVLPTAVVCTLTNVVKDITNG